MFNIIFLVVTFFQISVLQAANFAGVDSCTECHSQQAEAWQGSHHDLAMQVASDKSVLGDFNDIKFKQFDVISTFYKKEDQYWVRTDGPNGTLEDYQIKYTFGVNPLQQYLIEFPGGRLQVLDIAWDNRPKSQGGERWYHLHPEDKVAHDDVLHWTGPNLNWNYMCADCHSTNLKKNYNEQSQTYDTQWTDIDVSCEACHGPGSEHINWAKIKNKNANTKNKKIISNKGLTVKLNERKDVTWLVDGQTRKPLRSTPNDSRAEIQVCARCHSRRRQLTDEHIAGQPFLDAFHPALLERGLYHADGQMQDEVYVWGSFRQSKMYNAGVTCSDCHDPHLAELKAPSEGVCYQCHEKQQYASEKHHFHKPESAGSSCIECHMPTTTFMGIDKRHDHSFRIPRPALSSKINSPNACNQCHQDKTPKWSAKQLKKWLVQPSTKAHPFAESFYANFSNDINSQNLLLKLAIDETQNSIVRATALSQFSGEVNRYSFFILQQSLSSEDSLVRQGALNAVSNLPEQQRIIAFPLVWDEIRSVRIQAARLLAGFPMPEKITAAQKQKLKDVINEYIEVQTFTAERPESQVNLAGLYDDLKENDKAETAYRKALQLQPLYIPAYINFAQSLSNQKKEIKAEEILEVGIANVADSADLYHALGLSQVRQKNHVAAITSLARAAELAPNNRRYAYVYSVALHSVGKITQAIKTLENVLIKYPDDVNTLYTLVTFNSGAGQNSLALRYAKQLQLLLPKNPEIKNLVDSLKTTK